MTYSERKGTTWKHLFYHDRVTALPIVEWNRVRPFHADTTELYRHMSVFGKVFQLPRLTKSLRSFIRSLCFNIWFIHYHLRLWIEQISRWVYQWRVLFEIAAGQSNQITACIHSYLEYSHSHSLLFLLLFYYHHIWCCASGKATVVSEHNDEQKHPWQNGMRTLSNEIETLTLNQLGCQSCTSWLYIW